MPVRHWSTLRDIPRHTSCTSTMGTTREGRPHASAHALTSVTKKKASAQPKHASFGPFAIVGGFLPSGTPNGASATICRALDGRPKTDVTPARQLSHVNEKGRPRRVGLSRSSVPGLLTGHAHRLERRDHVAARIAVVVRGIFHAAGTGIERGGGRPVHRVGVREDLEGLLRVPVR